MGEPALKIEPSNYEQPKKDLKGRIFETHTEELIIGLCGPIGTDLHFVGEEIAQTIHEKYNYTPIIIKLSDFIRQRTNLRPDDYNNKYEYLIKLIEGGNTLRKEKKNSVLAELAINEIAVNRELKKINSADSDFTSQRICYIIDSIKNNEELELFRLIYTDIFYFIGVFSNIETREKNLEKKGLQKQQIYQLIDIDSGEEIDSGQKVADTFVQADFFLRIDQSTSSVINNRILRYLSLIFSSDVVTPTVNETAMYQAFAAAGNSACLSRQVGASIINKKGEIISVGWNDVPKFNGGVYMYSEDDPLSSADFRCINMEGGVCFNDDEKNTIRNLLLNKLIEEGIVNLIDKEKAEKVIKNSRLKELIEFSRAVHAEMHAIIIGSQKSGNDIINGKLFCTTYPCHNCARHIVVAGITEVYYIEPYRKSLALKLHSDSITENENEQKKLRILMFDGVSPRRYLDFFKMSPNTRKENGKRKKIDKKNIFPKSTISLQAIPILEKEVIRELQSKQLIEITDEPE